MEETKGKKFIQILLVDDNPADVRLILEVFKEGRIKNDIIVASDGVEAMQVLKKEGDFKKAPRPDLIVLDLNMPRRNGFEFLMDLKQDEEDENLKSIPIVVLSTSRSEKDILKSYDLSANCYISKPVNINEFIKIVKAVEDFWLTVVKLPD